MSSPILMRIMALSINAAKKAGEIIRDVMAKGELNVVDKGINDFQTEADRSAQRCIISSLSKQFKNLKIIGEEGYLNGQESSDDLVNEMDSQFLKQLCPDIYQNLVIDDLTVWVDPLDGTNEYTQGFVEHVTVLIGIAVKSLAVAGVIHQPFYKNSDGDLGRTIWGLKGLGTGGFSSQKPPDNKFIVTTTRSHFNEIVQSALDAINPTEIIKVGGAGFKVIQLLEGNAHAYVFASPGCKKWDTCAPEAVLEALGGTLTDVLGNHYEYHDKVEHPNKQGVLATNGNYEAHQKIIKLIPENVKTALNK